MKIKLFKGDIQYNSKADLCETIRTAMLELEPAEVRKLIKSIDNR